MARTVNPAHHERRRSIILGAAYRRFAQAGFDRTSTASICRAAGISSGTFFHYFPTKIDVLVAILTADAATGSERLARISSTKQGLSAVLDYAAELEAEMADEHFAGFVAAVVGAMHLPEVATAVRADSAGTSRFIHDRLGEAALRKEIRTDVSVESLATWVGWLLDGSSQGAAGGMTTAPGGLVSAVSALCAARP